MFRNGPEVDGGGTAYLGPTTIIEMTIPMSQSSSDATLDDSWVLAGPINNCLVHLHLPRQDLIYVLQQGPRSPFRELDVKAPIRQQLSNLVILEYAVIYVFLPSHNFDFEVVKEANPVTLKNKV